MTTEPSPLTALPAAALDLMSGDLRKRLIAHLHRWEHHETLLAYLERWLVTQPTSVLLREARARVLVELDRGHEALLALSLLDAERPPSAARRQLRLRALIAAGRFEEAHAAIDANTTSDEDPIPTLLARGDALRAAGRGEEAEAAYHQIAALDPDSPAAPRRLAKLALERDDPETARGLIDALMLRPDFSPAAGDLRILLAVALREDDAPTAQALRGQLLEMEQDDRRALVAELGLDRSETGSTEPLPAAINPEGSLPPEAHTCLREQFGLHEFRPNQARIIAAVLAGRSSLAIMPTGAGKSLTYQLPAMLLPKATVVVSPLIALMKDQIDGLPEAVRHQATLINSSLPLGEVRTRLAAIASGRYRLIYIAPERLRQRAFLHALAQSGVSLFVIDEAHCVSLWGQSFRPDYLFIAEAHRALGGPPMLALTATASPDTRDEIRAHLGHLETISASVFRPNLFLEVVKAGNREEKERLLVEICRRINGPIVIYARSRQTCEELAILLQQGGVSADFYHAQVTDRAATQERFMRGNVRVLVATVAFGMGIDKADIRAIIHYNLPSSIEAYQQEAGRAGRDGRPARCILFYSAHDKSQLTRWLDEELLTRERLRTMYRSIRGYLSGRYGIVDLTAIERDLRDEGETSLRVGLSLLERAGLLRRSFDLPQQVTVTLREAPAPLAPFCAATGLVPGLTAEIDLLSTAETLGLAPDHLEAQLLDWHAHNYLRFRGAARAPLIELLDPPPDAAARIDNLLSEFRERQQQRIDSIGTYARAARCRHRTLADHFGQRLSNCRSACDICAPSA